MTTWWDVYETISHFLIYKKENDPLEDENYKNSLIQRMKLPIFQKGTSLFFPIENRNCSRANIPEYLCSCDIRFDININSRYIKEGTQFMIDHINNNLLLKHKKICMPLSIRKIIEIQGFRKEYNKFSVIFEVNPNNATFDGTFLVSQQFENVTNQTEKHAQQLDEKFNKVKYNFKLVGKIIRINTYGTSSNCINDYFLKYFDNSI